MYRAAVGTGEVRAIAGDSLAGQDGQGLRSEVGGGLLFIVKEP